MDILAVVIAIIEWLILLPLSFILADVITSIWWFICDKVPLYIVFVVDVITTFYTWLMLLPWCQMEFVTCIYDG